MNAERLLAHFERISEAPDAIARLRRFILDLAVRGKLVEQDPEDEPAVELLGRILELKIRSTGKLPKNNSQMIDRLFDDEPFAIPDSWTWVVLGQITDLITSGSRDWAKHYSNSGAIFVRMGNLVKGDYRLRLDSIQHVSPPAGGEGTRTRLEAWDVLVSITGDVGMLGLIPEGFGEAYINQHTALARPCFLLKGRYLPEFLRSDFAQNQFQEPQRGIKNSFRLSDLSAIVVPLPPLAEQHRIVAKVDELMVFCDQLEAARQQREQGRERLVAATLQRLNQPAADPASFRQDASFALQLLPSLTTTPAQIKQLRQTILNLAVRGKLVEQDPEDEPAEELLAGVAEEKVRKSSIRSRKADAIMSDDSADLKLFSLHKGWQWTTLEEYSLDVSTGPFGSMLHQADYIVNGIPVVNPSHMIGGRICPDLKVTISPGMADRLESYKLTAGDIVMARRGEVGRAALVTEKEEGWLCGTGSFIVRFIPESLRAYVLLFLSADLARSYLLGSAIGATMTNLNHGILKKMPIPLPPLAEQHRIVAKVDVLMALCDQLEQQLSQADQQRRRLLEAVVAEALQSSKPALGSESRV
jgi:type I restriction enzyme S subunit